MFKTRFLENLSRRRAFFQFLTAITLFKFGFQTAQAQTDYFIPGYLINLYLKNEFPISKQWIIVKLELSNPEVGFLPRDQRFSLFTNIFVTLADRKPLKGHIHCSSGFNYEESKKSIRLKSPTIDQMSFDSLSDKENSLLQQINGWVSKLLDGLTIYEFKQEGNSFLNKTPKKILIEENGIRIFF